MNNGFEDKIAVITGAASGIGHSVAEHFAQHGARVVGVDLNPSVGDIMKALPGKGHHGVVKDLVQPDAAQEVIDEVTSVCGTPQILVNSAGVGLLDPALDVPASRWQKTLDINLSASFYMAQAAGRVMVEQGYGRIVNLASQAAVVGLEHHAAYCASKAGILGFTRVLAMEWARHGVTVNAVSPTIVDTPLGQEVWAGEKGRKAKSEIPVGRFARPDEVASLIAYLCSDIAGMITAENVLLDGGYTAV